MTVHSSIRVLLTVPLLLAAGITLTPLLARAQDPNLNKISSGPLPGQNQQKPKPMPGRLEEIVFRAPDGWKINEASASTRIFLAPDNAPGKEAVIILLRGPEFNGEFGTTFENTVSGVLKERSIIKKLEVQSSRSSEGYDVLSQVVVSDDKQGQRTVGLYVAVNMNGRLVFTGYVATTPELFTKYTPVMTRFLADLDLPASKAGGAASGGPKSTGVRPIARTKAPEEVARDEDRRRKPGKVVGNIYDAEGRPFHLPGCTVNVHVWGITAAGERTFFDGQPDAQGHYEIPVVHGLYAVNCTARMPLGGQLLSVDLEVLDGRRPSNKEDSTPGICKDFGLKLTGPVFDGAPGAYHGGSVTLTDGGAYHSLFDALSRRYPEGTVVKLTLTPRSRLIDGSEGQPLTLTYDLTRMQTGQTFAGIPLALYTATAQLVTPGGQQKPLKIGPFPGNSYGSSVSVVFAPEPSLHGAPGIPNLVVVE